MKLKAFGILVVLLGASVAAGMLTNNALVLLTLLAPLAWFIAHVGRRTRWFLLYATMWMIASMLMTRIYDWPKDSEMTQYQKTVPGQISTLIGASLPSAVTGIVLGPIGPFARRTRI